MAKRKKEKNEEAGLGTKAWVVLHHYHEVVLFWQRVSWGDSLEADPPFMDGTNSFTAGLNWTSPFPHINFNFF